MYNYHLSEVKAVVERVLEIDETAEFMAMSMTLCSMRGVKPDAYVLVPGLKGEDYRFNYVIHEWNNSPGVKCLLIPGHTEDNPLKISIENLRLPPFNLSRTEGVIYIPIGPNTKVQADWVAEQVELLNIECFWLFAPSYHMLRAYLTFLKSLLVRYTRPILMIPSLIPVSPFFEIAGTGQIWKLFAGEVQRIRDYQIKGDVATFEELRQYLFWHHVFATVQTL